jgi:hypothetical protein
MHDRLLTLRDLTNPTGRHPRPALYDVRVLERELTARIKVLDRKVDALLDFKGIPTVEQVGEVDILCAAIAEQEELLEEARREASRHVERHRSRRERPRRWA